MQVVQVKMHFQYIPAITSGAKDVLFPEIGQVRQVFFEVYFGDIGENIGDVFVGEQLPVKGAHELFDVFSVGDVWLHVGFFAKLVEIKLLKGRKCFLEWKIHIYLPSNNSKKLKTK